MKLNDVRAHTRVITADLFPTRHIYTCAACVHGEAARKQRNVTKIM